MLKQLDSSGTTPGGSRLWAESVSMPAANCVLLTVGEQGAFVPCSESGLSRYYITGERGHRVDEHAPGHGRKVR